jgi:group II intron reverse transcriptase/maturase
MRTVVGHLDEALRDVARNKGAPGPDGKTVQSVRRRWRKVRSRLSKALLDGSYRPGPVRRVEIEKPGGGVRELGIPNVVDRIVQSALRRTLEPLWEPTFDASSHGFRPGRSCHTALTEAVAYLEEGYEWMVDLDLSKFFDRVHHQRLMSRIAQRVTDKPVLVLLGRLLRSKVVLPDGVVITSEEGVPQGGPLSPLLSNIVLDELDAELTRRGHRFVRYADDVAIFVKSERAGQRVMESITRFIEGRMRLKVNAEKSAVRRPESGNFLGFCMKCCAETATVEVLPSARTLMRTYAKIRELTPRSWGQSLESCMDRINRYMAGWFEYFKVCTEGAKYHYQGLDARIRRRLRAIKLKQWGSKRSIARNLMRMKRTRKVWPAVYRGRQSLWAMSFLGVVNVRLNNKWFRDQGFVSLLDRAAQRELDMAAPAQQALPWG